VRRRLERRIEALRDGAISKGRADRLRELVSREPEASRVFERTETLGRAVRDACPDPPSAPDPEALILSLRAGLRDIDRELATLPLWRRGLDRVADRMRPALMAGATAAALVVLVALPPLIESPEAVAQPKTAVRSLRQLATPVVVLEGGDGATIIWVLDPANPDLSLGHGPEGWA
jgi:hypothetical protein